ncbi:MAG: fatty acid desaturase [Bacteroidota bacterium]
MKDSLENIEFTAVINSNGKTYAALRKELKPVYNKVIWDIVKGYIFLVLIFAANAILIRSGLFRAVIAVPVSVFLAGYCLAYLHLFIHAAAHYDIHPDKSKNDKISDLFIGVLFGIPVKKYRKIHWLHHTNLGKKNDSEHSYFNELNITFLLKCITGLHTLSVILSRGKTFQQAETQKFSWSYTAYVFLFHTLLLFALFFAGGWPLLLIWLGALLIIFPLLATLRQLLEHRDLRAGRKVNYAETDHGQINRLFSKNILDSSFGAAGFNKHLLHHWDPTISYTRLQEVEDFLEKCPETASIIQESKTSYLKTFIALFKM